MSDGAQVSRTDATNPDDVRIGASRSTPALPEPGQAADVATRAWLQRTLLNEHTGVMLTLGYLALITIGILHESFVFLLFRVNILQYADPSDFVLAPLRDPLVIAATVAPLAAAWLYIRFMTQAAAKIAAMRKQPRKVSKTPPWAWALMTVLWIVAVSLYYSDYVAREIRDGRGSLVKVTFVANPTPPDTSPTYLIGVTGRAVFLYRLPEERTEIVPLNNVARMTIVKPPKKAK
jgi:hypothetical protein